MRRWLGQSGLTSLACLEICGCGRSRVFHTPTLRLDCWRIVLPPDHSRTRESLPRCPPTTIGNSSTLKAILVFIEFLEYTSTKYLLHHAYKHKCTISLHLLEVSHTWLSWRRRYLKDPHSLHIHSHLSTHTNPLTPNHSHQSTHTSARLLHAPVSYTPLVSPALNPFNSLH